MKKKIISILMLCAIMLCAFSITAFASNDVVLPALPDNDKPYYIVRCSSETGKYYLYYDSEPFGITDISGDSVFTGQDYDVYNLEDGQWVYKGLGSYLNCPLSDVVYSSDGQVANTVSFAVSILKEIRSILSILLKQITVLNVVGVLVVAVGSAVGLVFMWWGVRKLARVLISAFKKGKISL